MILLRLCLVVLLAALAAAPALSAGEAGLKQRRAAAEPASAGRVIVKFRAGSALMQAQSATTAPPQHAAALARRLGLALRDGRALGPRTQGLRAAGIGSEALARRLAALPDVEWAVPDRRRHINAVPNDPYYGPGQTAITPVVGQWYLRAPDATFASAINAAGAWERTHGSPAVTVAVLDTGVRRDHPDLAGKLYPGYDFIDEDGAGDFTTAADGDGRDADPTDPGDWTDASSDCGAGNSSWHGTRVAGLIAAATDNGIGMAGTARNVMLLPVRVLGKCGGYDSDIIAGMRWAAGLSTDPVPNPHPAKVLNMSLGSSGTCDPAGRNQQYVDAFDELVAAGVTVVVSAGNDVGTAVSVPANCVGPIAVAGLRHFGTKVGYSSIGPEVAIAAPAGNCVNVGLDEPCLYPLLTTTNAGSRAPGAATYSSSDNPTYGTSFSAPLVAGTAALMLSMDPTLGAAEIRAALQATSRPFPTEGSGDEVLACRPPDGTEQLECYCTAATCGSGMLDAAAAVAFVAPASVAPPRAAIVAATRTPRVGTVLALDSTGSGAFGGREIVAWQWDITSGAGAAAFSGATNARSATLQTSATGTVTVRLFVTDDAGATGSTSVTVTVQAAPPPSGGGGGALSAAWLAGLALAVVALARRPGRH